MIISLGKYKRLGSIKRSYSIFRFFIKTFKRFIVLKPRISFYESSQIRESAYDAFPSLNMDREDESNIRFNCVSCTLCQIVCPTDALKINGNKSKSKIIDGIRSESFDPYKGKSPKEFLLNTHLCLKCGACRDVCLVNGINMKGLYEAESIDLTVNS